MIGNSTLIKEVPEIPDAVLNMRTHYDLEEGPDLIMLAPWSLTSSLNCEGKNSIYKLHSQLLFILFWQPEWTKAHPFLQVSRSQKLVHCYFTTLEQCLSRKHSNLVKTISPTVQNLWVICFLHYFLSLHINYTLHLSRVLGVTKHTQKLKLNW